MDETDAALAMDRERPKGKLIKKSKIEGKRQQENGPIVKTDSKRKASTEHSDNVCKRRALKKPYCSEIIMDADNVHTKEAVARTCSKTTEDSDDGFSVRRVLFKKPDGKTIYLRITYKRKALAKPVCEMEEADKVVRRPDLVEPGCELKSLQEVTKRAAASVPTPEEMKQKLQDSYSKATKRRSTQLLDFKILPKPAQGSCQRITKRTTTTMNRSILKTASPFVLDFSRGEKQ